MELSYLLLTGAFSGLVSVLGHSVAWSGIALLRSRPQVPPFAATVRMEVIELLLHLLAGCALGLLFWLSWGFAALVGVSWWVRGLVFGGLCWLAVAVPAITSLTLISGGPRSTAAITALRWATTCLIAGLTCAWSWQSKL